MVAAWLDRVDPKGLHVTPEFMARLRSGDAAALRSLKMQKLTALYRKGPTRDSRRPDAVGLFWNNGPPTELIPFIRGGRHSPPAWLKGDLIAETNPPRRNTIYPAKALERAIKSVFSNAAFARRRVKSGEQTVLVKGSPLGAKAWEMNPNPKFELVVINKHDRGTLLKLLSELDRADSVGSWLSDRTERRGASLATTLFADYAAWCEQTGETPVGVKTFAQELVAAGVVKLKRSNSGERYKLELPRV